MFNLMTLFGIYSWRDIIELAGIVSSIYLFLRWLNRDQKSPLVRYCIGAFSCIYISYLLELAILTHFLLLCLPWVCVMFILVHQRMLQANYVAYDKQSLQQVDSTMWLQVIIRTLVRSMNNSQSLTIIIERTHSISSFVQCEGRMNAAINDDVMSLILEAYRDKNSLMMLIHERGYLKAVPVKWDTQDVSSERVNPLHDAMLVTAHNDALIISSDIHMRTFKVIRKGAITEHLNAAQLLTLLEQLFTIYHHERNSHETSKSLE